MVNIPNMENTTTINIYILISLAVLAILGWILVIAFLYLLKRQKVSVLISNEEKRINSARSFTDEQLQELVDLIPYAACLTNEMQQLQYANNSFIKMVAPFNINYKRSTWYDCLQVDPKKININKSEYIITSNSLKQDFKITFKPILNPETNTSNSIVIVEDISHLKAQIMNIEERKAYFNKLMSKSSFPIICASSNGEIIEANTEACTLLEAPKATVNNQLFNAFLPKDYNTISLSKLRHQTLTQAENKTHHIVTNNNNSVPVDLSIIPAEYFGRPAYFIFLKDISERIYMQKEILKAKLRAEESDRLKSSFLANMSHEVRTPLNSIMGFTELMSDEHISHNERKEFHTIVKNSSNELLSLLSDIMEYSKIESGLIMLIKEEIKPRTIIDELREYTVNKVANNQNLNVVIKEPIGLIEEPIIVSDSKRVTQALRHMLDNAIKFTYTGSITISYNYRIDNSLEFIISDTGIGIPNSKIPNIFHKFRQANDANSRDFGGAGLGLSICKHLADILGGFIWVKSEEEHGSDFHLIIPINSNINKPTTNNKAILFYANSNVDWIPFSSSFKRVYAYSFEGLLNMPLAHSFTAIFISERMSEEEMTQVLSLPQIQSCIILLQGDKVEVIHSPNNMDIGKLLSSTEEIENLLNNLEHKEY